MNNFAKFWPVILTLIIRFMASCYLYIWVFLDLSLGDFNLAHLVFLIIRENLDQRNAHVFCKIPSPEFIRKETNVELPFSYHLLTFRNKNKCEMFLKFLDWWLIILTGCNIYYFVPEFILKSVIQLHIRTLSRTLMLLTIYRWLNLLGMGWTGVSPKEVCWSPNLQDIRMCPY